MAGSASPADAQKRAESVQELEVQTEDVYAGDGLDPVYQAKARILNDALQEIGMGRYQVSYSFSAQRVCFRGLAVDLPREVKHHRSSFNASSRLLVKRR